MGVEKFASLGVIYHYIIIERGAAIEVEVHHRQNTIGHAGKDGDSIVLADAVGDGILIVGLKRKRLER